MEVEAPQTDIAALFDKAPDEMTDDEFKSIIAHFRKNRQVFLMQGKTAKKTKQAEPPQSLTKSAVHDLLSQLKI